MLRRAASVMVLAAALQAPTTPGPFPLQEVTAAQLQEWMTAGRYTTRQLAELYLQRIEEIDRNGPALRSVIEVNPDALVIADALDAERKAKGPRGPLHGIPILIKDNIDTADRMMTTAGSLALEGSHPAKDAFVVERLRAAGVLILGKTNLSEWANFRSTRSTSGWSSRGGQTKNPYVLDRNPCGSSSGTGAAIAASLAAIGVGTETDGSILCPSSVNGLVGIKPTVGLVSRSGIIPVAISQDTAGPMARTVADAAMLLTAMAGVDPEDPRGSDAKEKIPADYSAFLTADALKGKHFGLVRQAMGYHPDVDAATLKAVDAIKAAGGEVKDVKIAVYNNWNDPEFQVLLYEFKDGLNAYLKKAGAQQPSLEALIAWNKSNAQQAMPYFGQEIFEQAQAKGPLTDAAYIKARDTAKRLAGKDGLVATLEKEKLDALIAPTVQPSWVIDHVMGDHFIGGATGMPAVAGTPSITVPSGETKGLPLGVAFMGRAYSEGELIGYAYALEQSMKVRRPPQFTPTLKD